MKINLNKTKHVIISVMAVAFALAAIILIIQSAENGQEGTGTEQTGKSGLAAAAVTKIFQEKYPKYAETVSVKIGQQDESHLRGGVTFVEGEPGGIFLAAKIDGEWQVVFDGNGTIPCSLSKYGFPAEMLSDCI